MELIKVLEAIQTVSVVTGKPQQWRVAILRRDDGYFSFAEEYSYKSEYEGQVIAEGWKRQRPEGIFEGIEQAEEAGQLALFQRHKAL
jgi:hypothetical protein